MSTIRSKYSNKIHQNIPFCAELNEEYAGKGFMVSKLVNVSNLYQLQGFKQDKVDIPEHVYLLTL